MTPEIYASIMHTIYLNMAVTAMNFVSSCLIIVGAVFVRRATLRNTEWSERLRQQSERTGA